METTMLVVVVLLFHFPLFKSSNPPPECYDQLEPLLDCYPFITDPPDPQPMSPYCCPLLQPAITSRTCATGECQACLCINPIFDFTINSDRLASLLGLCKLNGAETPHEFLKSLCSSPSPPPPEETPPPPETPPLKTPRVIFVAAAATVVVVVVFVAVWTNTTSSSATLPLTPPLPSPTPTPLPSPTRTPPLPSPTRTPLQSPILTTTWTKIEMMAIPLPPYVGTDMVMPDMVMPCPEGVKERFSDPRSTLDQWESCSSSSSSEKKGVRERLFVPMSKLESESESSCSSSSCGSK